MLTTPRAADEPRDESVSAWPALVAALFAWAMAVARVVIGRIYRENADLDVILALGASLFIPSIVLLVWVNARRANRLARVASSRARPKLSLVVSASRFAPKPHILSAPRRAAR